MQKKLTKKYRKHFIQEAYDKAENPGQYGFPYIYVNNDGTARELNVEEREYLDTKFHPSDGGRPYIKRYCDSKKPDGKMQGFCSVNICQIEFQ